MGDYTNQGKCISDVFFVIAMSVANSAMQPAFQMNSADCGCCRGRIAITKKNNWTNCIDNAEIEFQESVRFSAAYDSVEKVTHRARQYSDAS